MISLRSLEDDVLGGTTGVKQALLHCDKDCPKTFHNIEVRQTILHHLSRIERALKVYVSHQKSQSAESSSNIRRDGA